jgi:hypothetical protein
MDYLTSRDPAQLQRLGVTNVESLFVSPTDGQPMVVLYGEDVGPPGPGGLPFIAYERQPTGGKRLVVTAVASVSALDEESFRQLFPKAP